MKDGCSDSNETTVAVPFERQLIASKDTPPHMYMKLSLEFDEGSRPPSDVMLFKRLLVLALSQLHGDSGAATPVDVLKYDAVTGQAIVRVEGSELVKFWSSLTLFSNYMHCRCRIDVEKVSPYLISLSKDSRLYEHQKAS